MDAALTRATEARAAPTRTAAVAEVPARSLPTSSVPERLRASQHLAFAPTGTIISQPAARMRPSQVTVGSGRPGPQWNIRDIPISSLGQQPLSPPRHLLRKLAIGSVNDPLEQEADGVAEQVMRMPAPEVAPKISAAPQVSRKRAKCDDEEEKLQKKEAGTVGAIPSEAPAMVHEVLRSPGQPLDAATRTLLEPRFGRDLSQIRVHTDAAAAESAHAIGATAYTSGRQIAFGPSAYAPRTGPGLRLLAHEVAHTIQQDFQPSGLVQREPGPTRRSDGPFVYGLPEAPNQVLSAIDDTVTVDNIDAQRSERTTLRAVHAASEYVDNGILSAGADIDNPFSMRILTLRLVYQTKFPEVIPVDSIDLTKTEQASHFIKHGGVIYPSINGAPVFDRVNTPNIVKFAEMKSAQREQLVAQREEIASLVNSFAGTVDRLAVHVSQMEGIKKFDFRFGKPRPSRGANAEKEGEPVGVRSRAKVESTAQKQLAAGPQEPPQKQLAAGPQEPPQKQLAAGPQAPPTKQLPPGAPPPKQLAPGSVPKIAMGDVKSIDGYNKGIRHISQMEGRDKYNTDGNIGIALYDRRTGDVILQVLGQAEGNKPRKIIYEARIGRIKIPQGRTPIQIGNDVEEPVRDLVRKATGQPFPTKRSNAPGPDLTTPRKP